MQAITVDDIEHAAAERNLGSLGDVIQAWVVAREQNRDDLASACWTYLEPYRGRGRQGTLFQRRCREVAAQQQAWRTWQFLLDRHGTPSLADLAHLRAAVDRWVEGQRGSPGEQGPHMNSLPALVRRVAACSFESYPASVMAAAWALGVEDVLATVKERATPCTVDNAMVAHRYAFRHGRCDWFDQAQHVLHMPERVIALWLPNLVEHGHVDLVHHLMQQPGVQDAYLGQGDELLLRTWRQLVRGEETARRAMFEVLIPSERWHWLLTMETSVAKTNGGTTQLSQSGLRGVNRLAQWVPPEQRQVWMRSHAEVLHPTVAWERQRDASSAGPQRPGRPRCRT